MKKRNGLAALLLSVTMIAGLLGGCGKEAGEAASAPTVTAAADGDETGITQASDGTDESGAGADAADTKDTNDGAGTDTGNTDGNTGAEDTDDGAGADTGNTDGNAGTGNTDDGAGTDGANTDGAGTGGGEAPDAAGGDADLTAAPDDGNTGDNAGGSKSHDAFDELSAEEITAQMGAGWNLGNQLEAALNGSSYETAWGNPVITPELLQFVREQGFSTVRIPVSYLSHIGTKESGYEIDETWMTRVNQVVDYAIDAGLYVIINVHGDGYGTVQGGWLLPYEDNQEEILEKYEAVWRQIAERYKDYDEHLIFESMNEVGSEKSCSAAIYKNLNAYNQTFLDTIRRTGGNNDKRWVLIPGYNTNIDKTTDNSGFEIPEDTYLSPEIPDGEHRIMISVHYYDPWSFCGGENDEATQWGADADSSKTANWGDEAYMEQQFEKLYEKFSSKGYPVVIGEYGSIDKSHADEQNTQFRASFAAKVCEKAIKYGLVPVYWDNGYNGKYGFGLFHRRKIEVTQPEIIEAIMGAFDTGEASEGGTATGITLSAGTLELMEAAGGEQLTAVLTPADCTDRIVWSSSDDSVATVSSDGLVRPNGEGTAVITAKCNGLTAECTVTVSKATATAVNLYILETQGWQTASGTESVLISENGSYSVTMKVSSAVLENIGSFYFKDTQVQAGVLSKSLMKSCKITVDSVTVNGTALTLTGKASGVSAVNGGSFDYCLLNRWATGMEAFEEFELVSDGDYNFSGIELQDTNEIVVNFTISDLVY